MFELSKEKRHLVLYLLSDGETILNVSRISGVNRDIVISLARAMRGDDSSGRQLKSKVHDGFEIMLAHVCQGVAQSFYHQRGRPRIAVNEMCFSGVMKVVRAQAARPFMVYLHDAHSRGVIQYLPTHSSLLRFMNQADTRQFLIQVIIHAADLLIRIPTPKRLHRRVRFADGLKIFGRTYDTLINEALCTKVAEMTLKCCLYGVMVESDAEIDQASLLVLLRDQMPPGLSKDMRDELYQEMVVAVLNGDMRPNEMRGRIGSLLRRVRHRELSTDAISLDAREDFKSRRAIGAEMIQSHR